ncbi:hypothetical protein I3843_05G134500 [Carya illinoinensis]|uniref:SAM domain-containing protein n=1 Tax=Carya illinoinensis TaxID=32201 RepID=A0A8T1QIY3_CARIL|nr:uncharacterized protein LOC122310804 [Carya illinoinensis]KAG2707404.1 hypothetical protein I3760_05G147100 [Carya illinoinensis]KAG2707405.1 hypothetical protein I3760_05G147100 [Carya illinoinensis]KAG6654437.1 hypothetical protein CIPAW_05G145800 [Carya illinoinensis]KAG7979497.1 hypothetical protein I3843_05G134500 [Carya illinoinensis]
MSGKSRDRITITLGRSGQVVKRGGQVSDVSYADSLPAAGTKRSVRDRIGSNVHSSLSNGSELYNKRQRGDISMPSLGANGSNDVRIGRDDLRFKLMKKNASRRVHDDDDQKRVDLREKLSKNIRPRLTFDSRQRFVEPKDTGFLGRIASTRSPDDLPRMDSMRASYSTWTLDDLRRRSPDRALGIGTSRGLSPPRNVEELHGRPLKRTTDNIRAVQYMRKDVFDTSRPMSTTPFMAKPAIPPVPAKPVPPPLGQLPPPNGIGQSISYAGDEQQTIDGLLQSLGLGKYAIIFKAEEVDITALKQMGENDLKELGIPMGPRKKILLALLPRSKRQP